jgi:hypothetical protein
LSVVDCFILYIRPSDFITSAARRRRRSTTRPNRTVVVIAAGSTILILENHLVRSDGIADEVSAIIVGVPSTKDMAVPMVASGIRAEEFHFLVDERPTNEV